MAEPQKLKVRIVIRAPSGNDEVADDGLLSGELDERNLDGDDEPEGWNWLAIGAALALATSVGAGSWFLWLEQRTWGPLAGDVALESGAGDSGAAEARSGDLETRAPADGAAVAETAGSEPTELQSGSDTPTVPEPEKREQVAPATAETASIAVDIDSDAIVPLPAEPGTTGEWVTPAVAEIASSEGIVAHVSVAQPPPEQFAASPGEDSAIVGNQLPSDELIDVAVADVIAEVPDTAAVAAADNETVPALAYAVPSGNRSDQDDGLEEILSEHLTRAQLSWGVYRREPTVKAGATVDVPGPGSAKIYFFTEVSGLRGQTIRHRWLYEGQTVATVRFRVGGDRWRVHSNKNLSPGKTGNWEVLVEDSNGALLGRRKFRVQTGQSDG